MKELSLHILDIAENSIAAGADLVEIFVTEVTTTDRLIICVKDNGKGMDAETVQKVVDPFITTRTTRKVGLGIPLLKAAAEQCNGSLSVESAINVGTTITISFQRSHIDRMPLGALAQTILHLVIGSPAINWVFHYRVNQNEYVFDDTLIKKELEGIPLTEPVVLSFLREEIESGINNIRPELEY